jgi:L-ribulose-5-phosphate 4-epimerase
MLLNLKREACEANRLLSLQGLAPLNFGNASAIDRRKGIVAIKPSGVDYKTLRPEDMVLVDLDGRKVEGSLRPSSDTRTHLELYRGFRGIGGVAHTHSPHATAFAQAGNPIPALGTTHADFFLGPVPVTRPLTPAEIGGDYETETGRVICETFKRLDPARIPAVLVYRHGPFVWGSDALQTVENAVALELCARLAFETRCHQPSVLPIEQPLLERHFLRKHGPDAYYGQPPSAISS